MRAWRSRSPRVGEISTIASTGLTGQSCSLRPPPIAWSVPAEEWQYGHGCGVVGAGAGTYAPDQPQRNHSWLHIGTIMSSPRYRRRKSLYLPRPKVYDEAAPSPGILSRRSRCLLTEIRLEILRNGETALPLTISGSMKRDFSTLVPISTGKCFPNGCFLLTGPASCRPDSFTAESMR